MRFLMRHVNGYRKLASRRLRYFIRRYVGRDVSGAELRRWFEDDGDRKLRARYDLNESSIVFDIGGYVGDFAEGIVSKSGSHVYLFEPSVEFYEACILRFREVDKVLCYNYGLSDISGVFTLSSVSAQFPAR